MMPVLPRAFYLRPTVEVAAGLLGKLLVREQEGERLAGRIVETEAYTEEDPASHSFRGLTDRSAPMFEEGGIAYVYLIYGIYHCFNVVTEAKGHGSAVLVRALEPVEGMRRMWRNRFGSTPFDSGQLFRLASGPGKLARAMGISRDRDNGKDLLSSDLTIRETSGSDKMRIDSSGRIGIRNGRDRKWRFYVAGSRCVSDAKSNSQGPSQGPSRA
jgi:DNA-3-methyladenine glycosylase